MNKIYFEYSYFLENISISFFNYFKYFDEDFYELLILVFYKFLKFFRNIFFS